MLTIEDFTKPAQHPWGMLSGLGLKHAAETESFMAWFLGQCIKAKDINAAIATTNNEDWLAAPSIGLLELVPKKKQTYRLTQKAKGLLYVHYGRH